MEVRLRKDCECIAREGILIKDEYLIRMYLRTNKELDATRFRIGIIGEIKQCVRECPAKDIPPPQPPETSGG